MAPIKHNRDAAARNRDKTKRRRKPAEHANHLLYKCMGDLCGEECDEELQPVSQRRSDIKRMQNQQEMDLDAAASDPDDADYVDERERRRQPTMKAAGRVNKVAAKKTSTAKQIKDMPVKLGLQKAERYLCSALDFGVQAGYLTPKDAKGRVLRVASGLLQTTGSSVKRVNTDAMEARALERRAPAPTQPRSTTQRRPPAAAQRELLDMSSQEVRDDEGAVADSKRSKRSGKKARSRSKHGKKRSMKSRSHSRSKRKHGGGRKRSMGRSRSVNPDAENRNKQTSGDGSEEQDDLGNNSQETTGSSNGTRNDDDGKSVKSAKSSKSAPNNNNNDSQTSSEDKKHIDNDASNDDDATDDDDDEDPKE